MFGFGRKNKRGAKGTGDFVGGTNKGNPIGKIGIDDLNTKGQGLGVGPQNELSFSVLHAKSNAADQPVSYSPNTVTRPVWDSSSVEVKMKKQRRLHSKYLATGLIVIAAVALIAGVAALAHTNYKQNLSYSAQLAEELKQVKAKTEELQALEDLMSALLSGSIEDQDAAEIQTQWSEVQAKFSAAQKELEASKSNIEALQTQLSASDKEASNQALIAISAQLNIIDLSEKVTGYALPALQAAEDAESVMDYLLEADSLAREASQLMDDPTSDTATQSISVSEQSKQAFSDANYLLGNVQSATEDLLYGISETGESEQLAELAARAGVADADGGSTGDAKDGDETAGADGESAGGAEDGDETAGADGESAGGAEDGDETADAGGESEVAGDTTTTSTTTSPDTTTTSGPDLLNSLLSPYYEYISLRTQAQDSAIAMDNAYINMDKAIVISETETYNSLETSAASLMSGISVEPIDIVQAVYGERRASDSKTFSSERARLEVALTAIDDYLE